MANVETTSRQELEYLIRARYGLVYVVSSEEERVEEAIKATNEKLQEVVQTATGEAYKAATEAEQKEAAENPKDNDESSGEKKDDGPVVEAEVVDEDKK